MKTKEKTLIEVRTIVKAPIKKVWKIWNTPRDIMKWNTALETWHTVNATNDLREGGKFSFRMEAKDGSTGFDFGGIYGKVVTYKQISSILGDGRKVNVTFSLKGNNTEIVETFEAEDVNPVEMQRTGWQAILNNFKKYTEENK